MKRDTLITTKATGPRSEAIYSFSQGDEGELLITAHNTCGLDGASRTFNVAKLFDPESENPGLLTRGVLGLNAVEDICAIVRAVVTGPAPATMPSSGGDVAAAGGGSSAAAVAGGIANRMTRTQALQFIFKTGVELAEVIRETITSNDGEPKIDETDGLVLHEAIGQILIAAGTARTIVQGGQPEPDQANAVEGGAK